MNIIKSFFAVLVPLLIIDSIWLFSMNKPFYSKHLGFIMNPNPVWIAIILFYVIYAFGLAFLIVAPALSGGIPWTTVLLHSVIFGIVAYGTYDLTNQATLTSWPAIVTIVDLVWGGLLTGIVGTVGYLFLK
jgi:uncharacterized membrane protein